MKSCIIHAELVLFLIISRADAKLHHLASRLKSRDSLRHKYEAKKTPVFLLAKILCPECATRFLRKFRPNPSVGLTSIDHVASSEKILSTMIDATKKSATVDSCGQMDACQRLHLNLICKDFPNISLTSHCGQL